MLCGMSTGESLQPQPPCPPHLTFPPPPSLFGHSTAGTGLVHFNATMFLCRAEFSDLRVLSELIRLFESLCEALEELQQIEEMQEELPELCNLLAQRKELYDGFRCVFAGHQFGLQGETSRALALIDFAGLIVDSCAGNSILTQSSEPQDKKDVELLARHVSLARCIVLANLTRSNAGSAEGLSESLQKLSLSSESAAVTPSESGTSVDEMATKLANILDQTEQMSVHVCDFPPFPRPFPNKPIFLDLALDFVKYPAGPQSR